MFTFRQTYLCFLFDFEYLDQLESETLINQFETFILIEKDKNNGFIGKENYIFLYFYIIR